MCVYMEIKIKDKNVRNNIFKFLDYIQEYLKKPNMSSGLYHYTSIEALYNGIIQQDCKLGQEICLRATNVLYLNDKEEIKIGISFIEDFIEKYIVKTEEKKLFQSQSDFLDFCSSLFVTSFSLQRDNLPMWRMYSTNATGIALCFDDKFFRESDEEYYLKCNYSTSKLRQGIDEYLKEFKAIPSSNDKIACIFLIIFLALLISNKKEEINYAIEKMLPLIKFAFSLKHPAYNYEEEIRLLKLCSNKEYRKFRYKDNLIIPYVEHFFPKESLTEIIVGPNNDMQRTIHSLKVYLKHHGFEHVNIIESKLPYRS